MYGTIATDDRHNVNFALTKLLTEASLYVKGRITVASGDTGESGSDEKKSYYEAGEVAGENYTYISPVVGESVKEHVVGVVEKLLDADTYHPKDREITI